MLEASEIRGETDQELAKSTPDFARIAELSDALADSQQDRLRFTVEASHINRLGLELVAKRETALSELIKNAYDADATEVTVELIDFEQEGGTLTLRDNGCGMSRQVIRDAWMTLSTASKLASDISPQFSRPRAGRKGIGRFATQRLGKRLILETTVAGESVGHRVRFDWDEEFRVGKKLSSVWTDVEEYEAPIDAHGTTLRILDLRDTWTEKTLRTVWKSILFLQPPFPIADVSSLPSSPASDPGFRVTLNGSAADGEEINLSIEEDLLQYALAHIEAEIDDDGVATVQLVSDRLGFKDKTVLESKYLLTGVVQLEARYFIFERETVPGISVRMASKLGEEFGGIRIHRNSFRVLPYGEGSNDWLKLDRDASRRAILPPANNANFFGYVSISDKENILLEETSSREGLVENDAFQELADFTRRALVWSVLRIASVRERKPKPTASRSDVPPALPAPSKAIDEGFTQLEDVFADLEDSFADDRARDSFKGAIDKARRAASEAATQFEHRAEEERARNIDYENMLRILASLGLSISVFGHEIKSATSLTSESFALLRHHLGDLDDGPQKDGLVSTTETLQSAIDRVFDLGGYIEELSSFTGTRKLQPVAVRGSIDRFVRQFSSYLDRHGVEFDIDVSPKSLRTCPMHTSEFDSILFNLLTNSIKAFQRADTKSPTIRIRAFRHGSFIRLRFEDNGYEIPKSARDRIFDAFYTTTEFSRDEIAGPGTGLGLTIVSDIAANYGGVAELVDASEGFKTALEVSLKSN